MKTPPRPQGKFDVTCACGSKMVLRYSKWGWFYGCSKYPTCRLVHSAHQTNGAPMGRPGTVEERKARHRAHGVFDQLWQPTIFRKPMHRRGAYAWMRRVMGLTPAEAHIGNFTVEQCEKLIALVQEKLKEEPREEASKEGFDHRHERADAGRQDALHED